MQQHSDKDMSRCIRRFHRQRLKQTRKFYWGYPNRFVTFRQYPSELPAAPQHMDARRLGLLVNTPQMCSCLGCGNQRHNTAGWTPTLNERRWADQYREQLDELDESGID